MIRGSSDKDAVSGRCQENSFVGLSVSVTLKKSPASWQQPGLIAFGTMPTGSKTP